jgi:hypothetical protein
VEEIEFNINYMVKVKLNEKGRRHLFEDWHNSMKGYPANSEYIRPIVDDDGYTEFQLWELMSKLGPHTREFGGSNMHGNVIICKPREDIS